MVRLCGQRRRPNLTLLPSSSLSLYLTPLLCAALPDRVDLLRVQQLRGVGGNAWRTSHNPPEPVLLDIADRLGILVLDENRVLATQTNCDGCGNVPQYFGSPANDVGALAVRDRNHASVIWYRCVRWPPSSPS